MNELFSSTLAKQVERFAWFCCLLFFCLKVIFSCWTCVSGNMFLLYLFYFLFIFTGNLMAHKRKLSTVINPGCTDPECDVRNESSALFVHVRAVGDNDTLHHVWDFTYCPSLIIARTAHDTYLDVTWDKYLKTNKVSVNFSAPPKYLFGVTIDRLFEFNDESDVGVFNITNNKADYVRVMHTHDFHWKLGQSLINDTETALLSVEGTRHDSEHNRTGVIRITMGAYGGDDHGSMLPHLLHSSNSSQMDIILENMPTKFAKSRFGVSLVTISSDVSNSTMALNTRRSLDDEHDPGVFTIVELTSPGARSEKECSYEAEGGYLQWRPVVYTSRMRDATYSLDSLQYDIVNVADEERLNNTLFQKLFGERLFDQLVTTTNVTFGNAGDKYYNKTNFSTWSFVAGVGCPMEEQFSMFVMLVLAIGLGLPILLIIFGVLCVVIRRLLKNKDDLFLSQ